jgi:hypothetical protein
MQTEELIDGAMVLSGGLLLLTPGFRTDLTGFLLLAPFSRTVLKGWLKKLIGSMVAKGEIKIYPSTKVRSASTRGHPCQPRYNRQKSKSRKKIKPVTPPIISPPSARAEGSLNKSLQNWSLFHCKQPPAMLILSKLIGPNCIFLLSGIGEIETHYIHTFLFDAAA